MRLVLFREFSLTIEYLSEIPRSEADLASRWLDAWPIMTRTGSTMTYQPIPDSADAESAGPAPCSANGTRPRSALLVACELAAVDLDGSRHQAG